jgi:cytochrome b
MNSPIRIQIWDGAVRLVHWLMVIAVAVSWWTAENGELEYHRYSGYTLLGLLVFRLYWGIVGTETARFANFVKGPRAIVAYLKALPSRMSHHEPAVPGHNPLGALSVIALLVLLITQVGLGLFAVDVDGIESGPLSSLVSFDTGRACAELHEDLFDILLVVIGLHVAAVLFYLLYKRQNLIVPMITGKRDVAHTSNISPIRTPTGRLIIGILVALACVWLVTRVLGT